MTYEAVPLELLSRGVIARRCSTTSPRVRKLSRADAEQSCGRHGSFWSHLKQSRLLVFEQRVLAAVGARRSSDGAAGRSPSARLTGRTRSRSSGCARACTGGTARRCRSDDAHAVRSRRRRRIPPRPRADVGVSSQRGWTDSSAPYHPLRLTFADGTSTDVAGAGSWGTVLPVDPARCANWRSSARTAKCGAPRRCNQRSRRR